MKFKKIYAKYDVSIPWNLIHIKGNIFSYNKSRYNLILVMLDIQDESMSNFEYYTFIANGATNDVVTLLDKPEKSTVKITCSVFVPYEANIGDNFVVVPAFVKYDLSEMIDCQYVEKSLDTENIGTFNVKPNDYEENFEKRFIGFDKQRIDEITESNTFLVGLKYLGDEEFIEEFESSEFDTHKFEQQLINEFDLVPDVGGEYVLQVLDAEDKIIKSERYRQLVQRDIDQITKQGNYADLPKSDTNDHINLEIE